MNRALSILIVCLTCSGGMPNFGVLLADEPDAFRPPAISTENVPVVDPELIDRLRQYQNVRAAGFGGWAPDGQGMLVATDFGNTTQLHRVAAPGGRREQLTFFDEPAGGMFLPNTDDGTLLVTMSAGGNENYQIYRFDRDTGRAVLLSDGTSRNLLGPVRHDGGQFAFTSNRRNGRDTDMYVDNPRTAGSPQIVLETDGEYWVPRDWSLDGEQLLILRYVSINESYPALLDIANGTKTDIPIPGGGPASYAALAFSPDGSHAYVSTDARSEFRQLARVDLATMEHDWLSDDIPWDVNSIEVDPKTGTVAFTVNENGSSVLYLLENDRPRRLNTPQGQVGGLEFSTDSRQLGFTLSRPDAPADAYSLELSTGELTRWTYSEVGGLDESTFVTPEEILFDSFDGRMIPAYYFKPRDASRSNKVAVLINIHGGPEGQYRPRFSSIDQFYVNELGIAVIRPNVRGSAGYGKTYVRLDNAERREDSVRDIGALIDWVNRQPELDASRVAVYGGSYGGYMVLASLTNFPDKIKAGVDIVGIASFYTFLKNTSAYRRDLRRAEYGDERDPKMREVFQRIDPVNNADKIRSALLVAHGVNDPRVPFSEAEQIAPKVRANGQEVWTVYADNEGHGFRKRANRDYLSAVITMFLAKHLK